jgi:hypothetical protein
VTKSLNKNWKTAAIWLGKLIIIHTTTVLKISIILDKYIINATHWYLLSIYDNNQEFIIVYSIFYLAAAKDV